MSDSVREALDALIDLRNGAFADYHADRAGIEADYQLVKSALSANGGEAVGEAEGVTPAANWREAGEPDPFGDRYDCPRSTLPLGDRTDDELANEAYLYDHRNGLQSIGYLDAVKQRIRWLSRRLVEAEAKLSAPAAPSVAVPDGWKLVPVKVTREMCEAAAKQRRCVVSSNMYATIREAILAAPSPDHIADAGKVVPIGYLTNQAVARLQSDKRLNGEHLYAFKPDDLSKFQAVYLAPTVNESLTIEDFNGMCRIVEAVSQMTDGFAIDQCHIDRAREIVQDAARLRTAGDEGESQ